MEHDVIVIGGGPGGYPAAIRLAREGLRVALVEAGFLGGECTNYGCVPTKALLRAARMAEDLARYSWAGGSVDPRGVLEWARDVARQVREGVGLLLERSGVSVIKGRVARVGPDSVVLSDGRTLAYRRAVLLAVGSRPREVDGLPVDGRIVHNNRTILSLEQPPGRLIVVGAGYVGVEMAYSFASLGSEVSLVEVMDRPLPSMDRSLSLAAARALRRVGARLLTRARVVGAQLGAGGARLAVRTARGDSTLEADAVLVSVGRVPAPLPGGLEDLGVARGPGGWVRVDCHMRAAPRVYAAGDITGPPLLAHKAILQSLVAAENILGRETCLEGAPIPEVVYIRPELVSVSLPGSEAVTRHRIRVDGLARSRIEGEGGFVELHTDGEGRIVKVLMAFEGAAELAGTAAMMVARGYRLEDAASIVFPHPTMSEALSEAAHSALGRPVHVLGGR